jgi:type II secretory pathway pseudopilin PulG
MKNLKKNLRAGFTLIELIFVLGVIFGGIGVVVLIVKIL